MFARGGHSEASSLPGWATTIADCCRLREQCSYTLSSPGWLRHNPHLVERATQGGLSGQALLADTVRIVDEVRTATRGAVPIAACGGVATAEDALACLRAGATTVQVYTGFVYRGPRVVQELTAAIASARRRTGAGLGTPAGP